MNRKTKISKTASLLLYVLALVVLFSFLQKNHTAYALHMEDVKNSAKPPLAIGADVPNFTLQTIEGSLLSSSELPEKYVLVLVSTDCPYAKTALEFLEQEGQHQGITAIYGVYPSPSPEEAEEVAKLSRQWQNITVAFDFENSVKWGFRYSHFPTFLTIEGGKLTARQVGWLGESTELP